MMMAIVKFRCVALRLCSTHHTGDSERSDANETGQVETLWCDGVCDNRRYIKPNRNVNVTELKMDRNLRAGSTQSRKGGGCYVMVSLG
jgi:hypothetical protein